MSKHPGQPLLLSNSIDSKLFLQSQFYHFSEWRLSLIAFLFNLGLFFFKIIDLCLKFLNFKVFSIKVLINLCVIFLCLLKFILSNLKLCFALLELLIYLLCSFFRFFELSVGICKHLLLFDLIICEFFLGLQSDIDKIILFDQRLCHIFKFLSHQHLLFCP